MVTSCVWLAGWDFWCIWVRRNARNSDPQVLGHHPKKPPGTLTIWKRFWYTVNLDKAGYMHGGTGVGSISRSPIHQAWKCMGASAAALAGSMCYFRRRGHVFYHKNIIHHKWFKRCFIGLGQEYIKLTSIEGCTRISWLPFNTSRVGTLNRNEAGIPMTCWNYAFCILPCSSIFKLPIHQRLGCGR